MNFPVRLSRILTGCGLLTTLWAGSAPAPLPLAPVPSPRQLAWHAREHYLFLHFGVNTFTDREWGDGKEDPALFNPSQFDARQWARAARDAGFRMLVLTAKHHDGFCLWPSRYTDHSVKSSPWLGGKGDVVRDVSNACREFGLQFGVYLSPWDRHESSYGDSPRYNEFYRNQMTELLTQYGEISMVWFDGACGEGPNGKRQVYDWASYHDLVRKLAPNATMFSDAGPDVRWVGNESGLAKETNWCLYDRCRVAVGGGVLEQMGTGTSQGMDWVPAECDVSIRPGWFYHSKEDDKVKSLAHLLDIYFRSVGQNASLHLNVPPDRRGLLHENDVARLKEFRKALDDIFKVDLAKGRPVRASQVRGGDRKYSGASAVDGRADTYWATDDRATQGWIEVDLGRERTINVAWLEEFIPLGQRVAKFRLEGQTAGGWKEFARGTTIGAKRLLRFSDVTVRRVRLVIDEARACPTIARFGLFQSQVAAARPGAGGS